MKAIKRHLILFLTAAAVLALTACGKADTKSPSAIANALDILETTWEQYPEENKFAVAGGAGTMDAPDTMDVKDGDTLDNLLGFPKDYAANIDDAAGMLHAMNANSFTCGVFHVKNSTDISEISDAIDAHLNDREWMCGFPEQLLLVSIDDYLVSCFGAGDLVDSFQQALTEAYPEAETIVDKAFSL